MYNTEIVNSDSIAEARKLGIVQYEVRGISIFDFDVNAPRPIDRRRFSHHPLTAPQAAYVGVDFVTDLDHTFVMFEPELDLPRELVRLCSQTI